jgi:small subunit ribosomal protein S20
VRQAIDAGDKAAAQTVFQQSVAVMDRIADKKIVHKNKTSRTKSRLSAQIKAIAVAA